jgi:hypothetical protein
MILSTTEPLDVLAPLLTIGGIIAIIAYAVSLGTRTAHKRIDKERAQPAPRQPPLRAFPVQPLPTTLDSSDLVGPGRFKVTGVDRQTRMDTVWHCQAENEANARVKAELEGIVVTAVERA